MKLRVCATLLMAFTYLTSSVSHAQWGYGMYGGMQGCQGYGAADGASSEDDEKSLLIQERAELRREKRDLEKEFRSFEREKDKLSEAIGDVMKPDWARVVLLHMDKRMNCGVCSAPVPVADSQPLPPPPPTAPAPVPRRDPAPVPRPEPEIIYEDERPQIPVQPEKRGNPINRTKPKTPRTKVPKPKTDPNDLSMNDSAAKQSRMPAAEERPQISARGTVMETTQPGDDFGGDFGDLSAFEGFGGKGSPTLCYPNKSPYAGKYQKPWLAICRDGGKIESIACTHRGFQNGEIKPGQANNCARSLDRYRRLVIEMDKAQARLAKIDEEIDKIGWQLKDLQMAERANRDLEAGCPTGNCPERGSTRTRRSSGPTLGQALLSMLPMALNVGSTLYLGHEANKYNRETGNQAVPLAPYVAQSLMGYPYMYGGIYGGMYGGVAGGFGCSPSIGGGGYQMGPYGMMGPGMMYPGVQGGVYGQVGVPWGYPQGTMPGYPVIGGGMYAGGQGPWGQAGPWGVGTNWPGGYPGFGVGVGGQIGVGVGAGYPGFPYPGGGGYPGYPGGGYPGGYPGYPGFGVGVGGQIGVGVGAGYPGFPFTGGGAAYNPYAPYPSMYPGMTGYPGMYPGGYPGYPGSQYPGFPPFGQQDSQILARQIEQQRSSLMLQQSFIQEYSSFMSKWQTYFQGGAGYSPYNSGIGYSPNYNSGYGSTGPTTVTPTTGRTRGGN